MQAQSDRPGTSLSVERRRCHQSETVEERMATDHGKQDLGFAHVCDGHLEDIPAAPGKWDVAVRGAAKLAATLRAQLADAVLFRTLATLDTDAPTIDSVDELAWTGPRADFAQMADRLDAPALAERADALARRRTMDA